MTTGNADRLRAEDWIEEGLAALAQEGPVGLKADRLAARLKVSRGSFYWHFQNVGAFHRALLEHWRVRQTEGVIERLSKTADAAARLRELIEEAMLNDHRRERALRAWATENPEACAVVAAVDKRRMAYLEAQFRDLGFAGELAQARARFVYWAYLGRAMTLEAAPPTIESKDLLEIAQRLIEN